MSHLAPIWTNLDPTLTSQANQTSCCVTCQYLPNYIETWARATDTGYLLLGELFLVSSSQNIYVTDWMSKKSMFLFLWYTFFYKITFTEEFTSWKIIIIEIKFFSLTFLMCVIVQCNFPRFCPIDWLQVIPRGYSYTLPLCYHHINWTGWDTRV